jgi:hypothetical protein
MTNHTVVSWVLTPYMTASASAEHTVSIFKVKMYLEEDHSMIVLVKCCFPTSSP